MSVSAAEPALNGHRPNSSIETCSLKASQLLSLPRELRDHIFSFLLSPENNRTFNDHDLDAAPITYHWDLGIYRTCHQLYEEARAVFMRLNTFIIVETPFPEAQQHISIEGHTPIVAFGPRVNRCKAATLVVQIQAPEYTFQVPNRFLLHINDLPTFVSMWRCSALSYGQLNEHLMLSLHLRNPSSTDLEGKPVPKALQKRLLGPFGDVKGLKKLAFSGNIYGSVKDGLTDTMKVPYPSVEDCFERANTHKETGNELMNKHGRYKEAVDEYIKAFSAIYVVCRGRRRSVWADVFFQGKLESGTFKGQEADMVRLVLRVKLVANIVLAYNKLQNWEDAHFWGMRTIKIVRDAAGMGEGDQDRVMSGFVANEPLGKIYWRTGIASRGLGDDSEARKFFAVAKEYLPRSREIEKDIASVALRLG